MPAYSPSRSSTANKRPIGLINRFKFLEWLASRFGWELVLKKPVSLLMDVGTHVDELGNRLLSEQNR